MKILFTDEKVLVCFDNISTRRYKAESDFAFEEVDEIIQKTEEHNLYLKDLLDAVPSTTLGENNMIEGGLNGKWTDDTSAEMLELLLFMGYRISDDDQAKESNYYAIWQNQILPFHEFKPIKDAYSNEEKFLLSDLKKQAV